MEVSPSFELIRSEGKAFIFADAVQLAPDAPRRASPIHFHPQIELVWFRKVTGSVRLEGTTFPLSGGQAVLLPSMQVHAFETGGGARDWVLLQFEPFLIEQLLPQLPSLATPRPLILRPDPESSGHMDYLCDWLCRIVNDPERTFEAQQIIALILVTLAATRPDAAISVGQARPLSGPLQDVLRRIHAAPRTAPSLSEAARTARVTDAHFSRLFKSRIGMGYAAYVQMHRLNIAARHLVDGKAAVSQIAYRVGFASASHFSTAFTERFGHSPRSFRHRATGAAEQQESERISPNPA